MAHRRADYDLILASYQRGTSVPEISRQYGISDKRIYYMLKLHGVTLRPRRGVGKILNEEQEAKIVALYQAGMSALGRLYIIVVPLVIFFGGGQDVPTQGEQ